MYKKKNDKGISTVSIADFNLSKWIDTPFAYTRAFAGRSIVRTDNKITSGLSLVQQQVLLIVASKFKKNMDEYYRVMRGREKEKTQQNLPLFSEDSVKEDVCGYYDIPLSEITVTSKNLSIQRDIVEQLKRLSFYVPSPDPDSYFDVVIFSTFHINNRKKTLEVKLNPDVVNYLLDMREGYIHHLKVIAEVSKKKYTPMFYFYMLHLLQNKDKCTVVRPLDELREYLGLVSYVDGTKEIESKKYPSFSDFNLKVIKPCQEELSQLAKQFLADITFQVSPVYDKPGKTRGNPENMKYVIERNLYGKLANDVRSKRKDVADAVRTLQGNIFDVQVHATIKDKAAALKPQVDVGVGQEKWNAFVSLVIEPSEKSLVSRLRFVGMKNERFCVECSDEDFEKLREKNGLEQLAKKFFGCPHSLAPVFYRG